MEEKILSSYSAKQVDNMAENILFEIDKTDWSADVYFTEIIAKLRKDKEVLQNSLGLIRSGDYTEELSERDAIFDRDIICFKNFVESNKYMREESKAVAAKIVWKHIAANDLQMYRLGYEEQIASANSLFVELDKPENKALIDLLIGAKEALDLAKESNANLLETYRKSKEAKSDKEASIAASLQQKKVRETINEELVPYLSIMAKAKPDTYAGTYKIIATYIDDVNTKARARSTRNTAEEPVTEEQE
ncbi:DUF6261 family protein [Marinifilum fragile]|uniref:DUF6261 family protein n=1 Tax=Marinifilum fragile TaxID=570161 RepID=UPI0006CFD48A|nr:DUF6261 family protein [Marinifilum fragile]